MTAVGDFLILSDHGNVEDCIIKARGSIDVHSAARFEDTLFDALITGPARIIVDLADVERIDEIAVDVLKRVRQRAYERGTTLIVQAAAPAIMPILQQHHLYTGWTNRDGLT